jgi:hypothetical protein
MMAQNDLVVVGIDVAKDKVDACIRAFKLRQTWPSTAPGQRKLEQIPADVGHRLYPAWRK